MAGQLEGKVAVIVGASSGIGKVTAFAFAQAGARVVLAARRVPEIEAAAHAIREQGGEAIAVPTDVEKGAEVQRLITTTVETYGRLDCAFNNAGIGIPKTLVDTSEEEWDTLNSINLKGIWFSMKYEIPAMLANGGGAIVNMASIAGVAGIPNITVYSATKGGIIAMSRSAAMEYVGENIRINTVMPGTIATELVMSAPKEFQDQLVALEPIGRMGTSQEVANAVVWLCSDAASFVTGHNMAVDGGATAR